MGYPPILVYGESSIGKTILALRALNSAITYWITTEAGALDVARSSEPLDDGNPPNPWGILPPHVFEVLSYENSVAEMRKAVDAAVRSVGSDECKAIVVDTLSSWANRDYGRLMGAQARKEEYAEESRLVARHLVEAVSRLQATGALVVCLCHEKEFSNLSSRKGGPALPGRAMGQVGALFSLIARARWDVGGDGKARRVLWVNAADPKWYTKDRLGIIRGSAPFDLRAYLRAAR